MAGFKLYEIDNMLREALNVAEATINPDTGEIPEDWAVFLDEIQLQRDAKCLAVAAYIRECLAEAEAVKAEVKRLITRSRSAENKAERLKSYLSRVVSVGEKMKDERVAIGWRKSASVVVDDESKLPESCFRVVREVSKTTVKELLTKGNVDGAHIEEHQNIQIR